MDERFATLTLYALGATALVAGLAKAKSRLELSRAKHRSLAGHARMARHVASLVPFYEFGEEQFFRSDDAPDDIAARRRNGFMRLAHSIGNASPRRAGSQQKRARAFLICNSRMPTGCRSSIAAWCASICAPARS
jgi:glutamate-1-semialdehyde 2,1-aminomutase